jgi:preprotein translocase SecE subunit
MAKARVAQSGTRPPRPPIPPAGSGRAGLAGYLRGVWEELKKVVWPARDELLRMTGIVLATVIIFAVLVGGADYLLSLGVRQAVATQAASSTPTAAPAPTASGPVVTAAPLPTNIPTEIPTVAP